MKVLAIGSHVTLTRYEPGPNNKLGKSVEYPAIVIGAERVNNSEYPRVTVAFIHPGRAGVLGGAQWRDAFDRCMSVPHDDDRGNEPFYYNLTDALETELQQALAHQSNIIIGLQADLKNEQNKHVATTEGKDEQLQKIADARAVDESKGTLGAGSVPPAAEAAEHSAT